MKYTQRISENTGIEKDEFLPGYSAEDGLHFDEDSFLHEMMEPMATFLIDLYTTASGTHGAPELKTVLDIGSGAGSLAYFIKKHSPNTEVFTLDGNKGTLSSPFINKDYHFIVRTDQEYEIVDENNNIIKFDLITSFEHLEHIQEEAFEQFLKNIMKHSHKDTLFLGTAASWEHEEEGMEHVHCNVKELTEWAEFIENLKSKIGLWQSTLFYDLSPYAKALGEAVEELGFIDEDGDLCMPNLETTQQVVDLIVKQFKKWNVPKENWGVPTLMIDILAHFFIGVSGATKEAASESWAHRFSGSVIIAGFGPEIDPKDYKKQRDEHILKQKIMEAEARRELK